MRLEEKDSQLNSSKHAKSVIFPQFFLWLISIYYYRPKYFNLTTFQKGIWVLGIFILWFCTAFWWQDMITYLAFFVFSAFTTRPSSLLESSTASAFSLRHVRYRWEVDVFFLDFVDVPNNLFWSKIEKWKWKGIAVFQIFVLFYRFRLNTFN